MIRAVIDSLWALGGAPHTGLLSPTEEGVPYRSYTQSWRTIAPLMDVYIPVRSARTGASVLLVHGGGFTIGSRKMKPMRFIASRLVVAGVAVAAIDYRMLFRGGRVGEALHDVTTAFRFWRGRCLAQGLDPDAVSLAGLSGGGTLAYAAAATTLEGHLHKLICCFGLYDHQHLRSPHETLVPRLFFGSADRGIWERHLALGLPPPRIRTLLLHGSEDGIIPLEQARRLKERRDQEGLPTRLVEFPGAPHGFFSRPLPVAEAAVREVIEFVRAV